MAYEIKADYSTVYLFPPKLEDWVSSDDFSRLIRGYVDLLDLKKMGFSDRANKLTGRPNYSNDLLLKVFLYGTFHGIRSFRKLEHASKTMIPLIWLTGGNIPDHNTLWRFWDSNKTALKGIFKASVRLAIDCEMVSFVLQAVDGTKIFANARRTNTLHADEIKKLLPVLDQYIEKTFSDLSSNAEKEGLGEGYDLPPKLTSADKLAQKILKGTQAMSSSMGLKLKMEVEASLRKCEEANTKHLNLTDEDARIMKASNRQLEFCYNAQIGVDSEHQIIVSSHVTNDAVDNYQLVKVLDDSKENTGRIWGDCVADSGYFSGLDLAQAEENGHCVLVNLPAGLNKKNPGIESDYSRDKFRYDALKDVYYCPEGKELYFSRLKNRKHPKNIIKIYRCSHFRDCPHRSQCSKRKTGREIESSLFDEQISRQVARHRDPASKKILQMRKEVVEPVFGWLKHNMKFTRWSSRGLDSVNAEWNLLCTGINLKKIHKELLRRKVGLD